MNDNYPPGAKYDKRAPYNRKEPDECPICKGQGQLGETADDGGIFYEECYYCDGTGCAPEYEPDPDSMKGGPDYE